MADAGIRIYEVLFGKDFPLTKPGDKQGPTRIVKPGEQAKQETAKTPTTSDESASPAYAPSALKKVDDAEQKALGYKKGGLVQRKMYQAGGEVQGPGGPTDDAVPAQLSDGEYVFPAQAVSYYGVAMLDEMVARALAAVGAGQQGPGAFEDMIRDDQGELQPGAMPTKPAKRP